MRGPWSTGLFRARWGQAHPGPSLLPSAWPSLCCLCPGLLMPQPRSCPSSTSGPFSCCPRPPWFKTRHAQPPSQTLAHHRSLPLTYSLLRLAFLLCASLPSAWKGLSPWLLVCPSYRGAQRPCPGRDFSDPAVVLAPSLEPSSHESLLRQDRAGRGRPGVCGAGRGSREAGKRVWSAVGMGAP